MKRLIVFFVFTVGILIAGCTNSENRSKGVYMLLNTSGTGVLEMNKARAVISYLLGVLQPNDTLAVARIDTESFNEKDIIGEITFNQRPSITNTQKRAFRQKFNNFSATAESSVHSDILGGLLHAIEYLNSAGSGKKYILIFADLDKEIARENIGRLPFQLAGFQVVAFGTTQPPVQNASKAKKKQPQLEEWRTEVENSKGLWRMVNHLESLENIIKE